MERVILHLDMNNFYASVECLYDPSLRGKPVAVGGDESKRHGIVLAKNQIAKKYGITTGENLWQARMKCPELVIVHPHFERYSKFSKLAREIYADYSDRVEPFGLDEVWMDITNVYGLGDGVTVANEIRERIKNELGLTISVGVSYNKIFAKLGSDYKKPDAVTEFTKDNYRELVWPLPMEDLLYVGRATTKKLRSYGLSTIGDIANTDPKLLQSWLGKAGLMLHTFANGYDISPVAKTGETPEIKSIGNSTTTPRDIRDEGDAKIIFYMLCECVAERLRKKGFAAKTIQISLRDKELFSFERQLKLKTPTSAAAEIHGAAMELLHKNYSFSRPLRSMGIRAADLVPAGYALQLSMFEDFRLRERSERLERAVDDIRRKYGRGMICRGITMSDKSLMGVNIGDEFHPFGNH
ncbi:MAG: DNA polymerase IV [Ruminococcaceae bacterium]|nr:DNA polymerase IV [Oscillospiraceae bacterium]